MLKANSTALIILGAAFLAVPTGFSQKKERPLDLDPDVRSVHGTVIYARREPVRGAVVKCTDTRTLQIRSYITGADGEYHFSNLSANSDYELKAEHNGRESHARRLSKFNGRKIATVNLRLK